MNDLTSWDNYSDNSDEEDADFYKVSDNIKKLLLRKYTSYAKEALTENEVSEILLQCNYNDEEIRRKVDEKLNSLTRTNKVQEWKTKENWKYQGKKVSGPSTITIVNSTVGSSSSVNSPNIKETYYSNVNGYSYKATDSQTNYNNKKKFNKSLNFVSKNSGKPQTNESSSENSSNYSNQNSNVTSNSTTYSKSFGSNEEEEIDHYFNAALKLPNSPNSLSEVSVQVKETLNEKTKPTHASKLSSDDIKEFVEEIKKNKDLIQKRINESHPITNDSSTDKSTLESAIPVNETFAGSTVTLEETNKEEIKEITKEENIKENIKEENKETPSESNFEAELHLDFDLSKIPNHLLNANNYNSYFFESNSGRREVPKNNSESEFYNNGHVNMKMNMNMNMNMQMYPGNYYNPMFVPNMGVGFPPVFYPMQGMQAMDPRMMYGPYFNPGPQGMYPQPFAYSQQFTVGNNGSSVNTGTRGQPSNPSSAKTSKL